MTISMLVMAAPEGTAPNPMGSVVMIFGVIAIFYFLLIRPQRKQQQEHQAIVQGVKKGDRVTTVGGIIGTVVHLTDDQITLKSGDTRLEIERSKISHIERQG